MDLLAEAQTEGRGRELIELEAEIQADPELIRIDQQKTRHASPH